MKGDTLGADELVVFMSLARKEEDVTRLSHAHRLSDGLGAIGDQKTGAGTLGEGGVYLGQNVLGRLGAGIVGGQDAEITAIRRGAAFST